MSKFEHIKLIAEQVLRVADMQLPLIDTDYSVQFVKFEQLGLVVPKVLSDFLNIEEAQRSRPQVALLLAKLSKLPIASTDYSSFSVPASPSEIQWVKESEKDKSFFPSNLSPEVIKYLNDLVSETELLLNQTQAQLRSEEANLSSKDAELVRLREEAQRKAEQLRADMNLNLRLDSLESSVTSLTKAVKTLTLNLRINEDKLYRYKAALRIVSNWKHGFKPDVRPAVPKFRVIVPNKELTETDRVFLSGLFSRLFIKNSKRMAQVNDWTPFWTKYLRTLPIEYFVSEISDSGVSYYRPRPVSSEEKKLISGSRPVKDKVATANFDMLSALNYYSMIYYRGRASFLDKARPVDKKFKLFSVPPIPFSNRLSGASKDQQLYVISPQEYDTWVKDLIVGLKHYFVDVIPPSNGDFLLELPVIHWAPPMPTEGVSKPLVSDTLSDISGSKPPLPKEKETPKEKYPIPDKWKSDLKKLFPDSPTPNWAKRALTLGGMSVLPKLKELSSSGASQKDISSFLNNLRDRGMSSEVPSGSSKAKRPSSLTTETSVEVVPTSTSSPAGSTPAKTLGKGKEKVSSPKAPSSPVDPQLLREIKQQLWGFYLKVEPTKDESLVKKLESILKKVLDHWSLRTDREISSLVESIFSKLDLPYDPLYSPGDFDIETSMALSSETKALGLPELVLPPLTFVKVNRNPKIKQERAKPVDPPKKEAPSLPRPIKKAQTPNVKPTAVAEQLKKEWSEKSKKFRSAGVRLLRRPVSGPEKAYKDLWNEFLNKKKLLPREAQKVFQLPFLDTQKSKARSAPPRAPRDSGSSLSDRLLEKLLAKLLG